MKFSFKKLLLIVFVFLILSVFYPTSSLAFLSPSTLTLISSSVTPYLLTIFVSLLVNLILLIKQVKKNLLKFSFFLSFILIIFIFFSFTKNLSILKRINQLSPNTINLTRLDGWDEFSEYIQSDNLLGEKNEDMSSMIASEIEKVSINQVANDSQYTLVNLGNVSSSISKSVNVSRYTWQIINNFSDQTTIDSIMAELGLFKKDQLVLYCNSGWTSERIAYILKNHGYNARYAALLDVKDYTLLDADYISKIQIAKPIITMFKQNPNYQYFYILLNYDDQHGLSRNKDKFLKLTQPITILNPNNYETRYLDKYSVNYQNNDDIINQNTLSTNAMFLCRNKLHCFLTKHYLVYLDINNQDKIQCIECHFED